MPALPEVEILRRDLEKEIVGRRIKAVEVRPGSGSMKIIRRHGRRKEFQEALSGAKVERVVRVGRRIALDLDNDQVLVFDLADKGQLYKTSATGGLAANTHIVIGFTIGGQLRLCDPKKTSEVFIIPKREASNGGIRDFGMDPLGHPIAWQELSQRLQERSDSVREVLMDDRFIVGLGPVYVDEILFSAGLRHDRPANKLGSQDVRRLYRALIETLQEAVKARGTSVGGDGFTDLQGQPGAFQHELKVFGREGASCRRCRSTVIRQKVDATFTYFCPQCQA